MTSSETHIIFEKIKAGVTKAIAGVYEDAYKNGTELVIAGKNGGVDWVKVVSIKNGKPELVKVR